MVGSPDVHLFTYTVVIILLVVPSVCVLYKMLKQVIICITAVLLFHPPPFEMQGLCAELPKIPITCNAGAYLVGTTASVICNFNKDMNTDKRPINVVRYKKSTFLDDPGTDVLLCQWKDKGQSYECKLETGFSIDGNITDHLRLKLPADTENFTGLYSCFIMHAQETLPNACELTVKGAVTPASAGNRQSTTIVEKRQSSTDANAGETGTNSVGVIVGVIVALLVLAGVIILVIFIMRRRRNRRMKTSSADHVYGSAPDKTLKQATKKSVNPSAAGPNDPLLPTHATRVPSPAARTAAPPPVQDDCEGIGGAYDTEQKSPDTDTPKGTYPSGCIEIDNNSSYNVEKSEIPSSPTTDREVVSLTQLYKLMQIVKTNAEALEEGKRSRASDAGTSNDSQTSNEILRTLLRKLRESGARLQRQAESRGEPLDVEPVISCVEHILDHVERGVDAKTHEAISEIPTEIEGVSCNIS